MFWVSLRVSRPRTLQQGGSRKLAIATHRAERTYASAELTFYFLRWHASQSKAISARFVLIICRCNILPAPATNSFCSLRALEILSRKIRRTPAKKPATIICQSTLQPARRCVSTCCRHATLPLSDEAFQADVATYIFYIFPVLHNTVHGSIDFNSIISLQIFEIKWDVLLLYTMNNTAVKSARNVMLKNMKQSVSHLVMLFFGNHLYDTDELESSQTPVCGLLDSSKSWF